MGWDLADLLARGGRGEEAETLLRELSRADPESLANLWSLWRLLEARHKDAEAHGIAERMLAPLRDRVARDRDDATAHWRLAILSWITGDIRRALASFREVARIEPENAEIRREIAVLLFAQRDLKGAIEAFRDSLRIGPSAAAYHRELAKLLGASGDYRGKVTELREAIRLEAGREQAAGTLRADGQDDPQRPNIFNCSIDGYADGLIIGTIWKLDP
jgi:tetratricopeptide (TPR) repeat protein